MSVKYAAAALLAVSMSPLQAQERPDTVRLEQVVVTATRLPVRLGAAPAAVTVLTGAELERGGVRHIADALRTVPGVAVAQSAGPGALTSVFMRGGESDYVQVLVDGVQVNDAGGAFNWAHLRVEDVERIEVVRGPVSVLYGSDAVSGVVQIFTRAGGPPRLTIGATGGRGARAEGVDGSFNSGAVDAGVTGSAQLAAGTTLRYGATAAHSRSNGLYAFNSDYDNTLLSARVQLDGGRGDAAVTARGVDSEYHYPTSGAGLVVDRNQFAIADALSLGLDAGYRLHRALELRLLATQHTSDGRTEDPADEPGDGSLWHTAEQTRRALDVRGNVFLPRAAVLTLGAEREWQEETTALESISSFGPFTSETDEARTNTGWYAQLHGDVVPQLALTVGGRIDDNEKFGTFRTGRAALSWQPARAARLHAAVGTAFKEPTFFEQFAQGFVQGNPELEPEESRSAEVGVAYVLRAISLTGTAFDQRFRNLIQYTGSPAAGASNYFNIGAARARGIELGATATVRSVTARAAYTFTATRVTDAGFGEDNLFQQDERLLRRPRHHATLALDAPLTASLRALLDVRAVGEREDLDFTADWQGARTTLPAYGVMDIGAGYTARAYSATLRIRNLFDQRYEEIYNFAAPGRVLELGLRAAVSLR